MPLDTFGCYNAGLQSANLYLPYSTAGGGAGQIKTYTADPNVEGVVPDDQTAAAVAYQENGLGPIYNWDIAAANWV